MKKRILFFCTGNLACSQMAEALMRSQYGDEYEVFSGGTESGEVDHRAKAALDAAGISTDNLRSKSISEFEGQSFDFLITLCNEAKHECSAILKAKHTIAWDFANSSEQEGNFNKTLAILSERIRMFVLVQRKQITDQVFEAQALFKSLSDSTRLLIMMLLCNERELCVCELMEAMQVIQPKISRNLALLKKSGIVVDRRQGQWVFYQINPAIPAWANDIIKITTQSNLAMLSGPRALLKKMENRPERCIDGVCS